MRIILLTLLISFLLQETSFSQVVHRDDLENFVGILKTSPPDRPRDLHRDSTYIRNEPLENKFTDFFSEDPGNLDELYPRLDEEGRINSRLTLGNSYSHFRTLRFYNGQTMLVLLKNDQFESGTYYLTSWKIFGDSLQFQKLYQKPLGVGIGSMRIDPNYGRDSKRNTLFVLQKITPGGGSDYGSYHLFQLTRYGDFHELLERTYFTDMQGTSGKEKVVMYKFLIGTDFLLQEYWYDIIQKPDTISRYSRAIIERTLTDSKLELIDLTKLVVTEY